METKKEVRVILSPEAEEVYKYLNREAENSKTERMILKSINQKIELIKANIHYGNPIAKNLIPEEYIENCVAYALFILQFSICITAIRMVISNAVIHRKKYNVSNLFRVELPGYWRMLYTLTNNEEIEIIAFVLDVIDHEDYDKKFGYSGK